MAEQNMRLPTLLQTLVPRKQASKSDIESVMTLIQNAEVYSPVNLGKKDVLLCGERILLIADKIKLPSLPCRVIDAEGKYLVPGLIDQHVHVTGGGGEGGFHTRTPEIRLSELIEGGITTVVGLLGTDAETRSVENLYAKTMALNEEGITAYMMTGAYKYDGPTITGEPDKDIVFIEKVLGVKLALSDHRSSHITTQELITLAGKARVAGMLSGKPGVVTLHMGSGTRGLQPVFEALKNSDIPVGVFRPTHVGRIRRLRDEAFELLKLGGYADFTCGSRKSGGPTRSILEAIKREIPTEHITVSSDGQGSWSTYDEAGNLLEIGVSGVGSMLRELRHMVLEKELPLETALPFFTQNVANALGLNKHKGSITEQGDADLLLLSKEMGLDTVIAKGSVLMESGKLLRKGTYEI